MLEVFVMSVEGIEEKLDEVSGGCGKEPEIFKDDEGKFHLGVGQTFNTQDEAQAYLKGLKDSKPCHHTRPHLGGGHHGHCCGGAPKP
jgi:hypothetical protein